MNILQKTVTVAEVIADYAVPLKILVIIIVAILLRLLLGILLRRTVKQVVTGVKKSQKITDTQEINASPLLTARIIGRTRTLGSVGGSVLTWVIALTAFFTTLSLLGVNVAALIASAGFIAAGLAFGAQNVVKDLLNGIFIIFEDQVGVGDVITVADHTGTVERVGLRVTQVRAADGTLWFIRNGEILQLGNHSYGWAKTVINVDVMLENDLQLVQRVLEECAAGVINNKDLASKILEVPEVLGVETFAHDFASFLVSVKTKTGADVEVARSLRGTIAEAFTKNKIVLGPRLQ